MDVCKINDGGLQHLGIALQDNETLTSLAISWNPFSSEALTYFLKKLTVCSRLTTLWIDEQKWKLEHSSVLEEINELRSKKRITPLTKCFKSPAFVERFIELLPPIYSLPPDTVLPSRKHY